MNAKYSYLDDLLEEAIEPSYKEQSIEEIVTKLSQKYHLSSEQLTQLKKKAEELPYFKRITR